MPMTQTRRRFLTTLSFAGAAGVLRLPPALAAEGLPETTAVRLVRDPGICLAPQYAAEELLRAEGLTGKYDYQHQALSELPYYKWREYDAEDTIRFYSLRLHEAGLIKATPNKIITDNTDWRFFDELKRELKA